MQNVNMWMDVEAGMCSQHRIKVSSLISKSPQIRLCIGMEQYVYSALISGGCGSGGSVGCLPIGRLVDQSPFHPIVYLLKYPWERY